jgi:hypothetical protein
MSVRLLERINKTKSYICLDNFRQIFILFHHYYQKILLYTI